MCSHLAQEGKSKKLGWVQAEYDINHREPGDLMAWCNECDKTYELDNGWNDDNDYHFKVVCFHCFEEINEIQSV